MVRLHVDQQDVRSIHQHPHQLLMGGLVTVHELSIKLVCYDDPKVLKFWQ